MTFLPVCERHASINTEIQSFTNITHAPLTLGLVGHEVVDLGGGSVVSTNLETLVGHVEDQVLTLTIGEIEDCRVRRVDDQFFILFLGAMFAIAWRYGNSP